MAVGYTADDILRTTIREIEKEAIQKITFQVEISTASVGGYTKPECGFEVRSVCVIRSSTQRFLIAYAKAENQHPIVSGIIAINLDQDSYAAKFAENINRIKEKTDCKFDYCLREYLNRKINGGLNEPAIQAKMLIEQYRFSKAAIISTSDSGSFVIDDKENWYMDNLAKKNGYLGYAVALQEPSPDFSSSFRYNSALARTMAKDIIEYIDMLAK